MDKRRSPRYAIQLNALVHPSAGRSWLCVINDFCEFGMLLTDQGVSSRRAMPDFAQGEIVGIHFSVPSGETERHFRLEGSIIRVMDSGIGINFKEGVTDDAMTALLNFSNSQPLPSAVSRAGEKTAQKADKAGSQSSPKQATASAAASGFPSPAAGSGSASTAAGGGSASPAPGQHSGIGVSDAKRVIAAIRKGVATILPEMTTALFSHMDDELLILARDAKNNAEQSEYFAAMSNLEKAKKSVSQQFSDEVTDQVDNPRDLKALLAEREAAEAERKTRQANKVKLSLVNTEEFEDWLAVANIISRSERVYHSYLDDIQKRMGMLVDSWAHAEANPVAPAVFSHAFDNAIRQINMNKEIRQLIYTAFESTGIPLLRKLYISLNKMMEESKIFPEIEDDFISPTPVITTAKEEAEDIAEPEVADVEDDEEDDELGEEINSEEDLRAQVAALQEKLGMRRRSKAGSGTQPRRSSTGNQRPASPRRARGNNEDPDVGEAINSLYRTVRDLVETEDYDEDAEVVELNEVQNMLSSLQEEVRQYADRRIPIRSRLQEAISAGGGRRQLPPEVAESLGVVENLVNTIEDDALLSHSAKDWIRQLELTLDKSATQTGNFLAEDNPHPSLEVINQLAQLDGSASRSIKRNVDQIVEQIIDNFDGNPEVWNDAMGRLQPLLDRQERAFTGNVERAVKASEGQYTLQTAQKAVLSELDGRISGREIPDVLMKLLLPGWRNLLVNTHLREGTESADWQGHIQSLDQLIHHFDGSASPGSAGYVPPQDLLARVEDGLEAISFEPGQRAPLLAALRKYLVDGEDTKSAPKVAVPVDGVAATLGFEDVSRRASLQQQLVSEYGENEDWQRCLDRIQRLHLGEWLSFEDETNEENRIGIVAFIDPEHENFAFVSRRGSKTRESIAEELATSLALGQLRILEEADIPLTDRASHRMLQKMHNQLTHQATHDELTSLINRKEFERELTRVLALAKREKSAHTVAYLDLDQFKVINNAQGFEAGDKLLKEIAVLLYSQIGDNNITLSRLGGDEFGVLIENCNAENGLTVIKQFTDAVKNYRFQWNEDTFSLTVSCGLVNVDENMDSVSSILQGADSACYAAKDAGRDRIQFYEADENQLEHRRNVLDFVGQIDNALEEDRFILNCQKIAPVDEASGEHAHYEILLTVLDENGDPMPPQDFIVAAETFNRMGAIDRWVIKNAFKFIAANILKLDKLGAFSINLSGNSLTEPDFMEYVLEQFNATKLPTSRICFEITETSAIGNLDDAIEFMNKLKTIGVQFSLDDFGTGLSSYSYLKSLPVDFLKIDGIFVKDIKDNPSDRAVVKSINEIGHFMGKKTIAEYVEDEEILEILREIGVDFAQGYGIGMKKPIDELLAEL